MIKKWYDFSIFLIFSAFIFLTLSLGRAFSIVNFKYIFITEVVLFLCAVVVFMNLKKVFEVPANFRVPFLIYFTIGIIHLLFNILMKEFYALRGIVFFGYAVFLFSSYIIFYDKKRLKVFLSVLFLSTLISLFLVFSCIYRKSPLVPVFVYWWGEIKAFNFVLFYGIALSFMLSALCFVEDKRYKFLVLVFSAVVTYMIMIWGVRTSWIALFVMVIFLLLILKKAFLKNLGYYLIVFSFVSAIFALTIHKHVFTEEVFLPKIRSLASFVDNKIFKKEKFIYPGEKQHISIGSEGNLVIKDTAVRVAKEQSGVIKDFQLSVPVTTKASESLSGNVKIDGYAEVTKEISVTGRAFKKEKKIYYDKKPHIAVAGSRKLFIKGSSLPAMEAPKVTKTPVVAVPTSQKSIAEKIPEVPSTNLKADDYIEATKKIRAADKVAYSSNLQWRLIIWRYAIERGLVSPVFGGGFNVDVRPLYRGEKTYKLIGPYLPVTPVHNHIISIFSKMGIIGLGLFLFMNIYCLLTGLFYLKHCKSIFIRYFLASLLGSLVFWHITGLFFDVIDSPTTNIFLWIILGLMLSCVHIDSTVSGGLKNEKF